MALLDNSAYLLLIVFILAAIYSSWEVKERNKVKIAENIKNENVYSPDDLVLRTYFSSCFSAQLTFMTTGNLPCSTT